MRILVVGSGGREHAICWKLAQSPLASALYCAPGNPGTARLAENVPLRAEEIEGLLAFAVEQRIDLTVVGPEVPLCAGIQDRFAAAGLALAGPSAAAARLEGSKAFAKEFMARHGIPTAPFKVFDRGELSAAEQYIDAHPDALVVKADGLAAGKGVFVCADPDEAKRRVAELFQGSLGAAGERVLVEGRLTGQEASFIVLADGERICPLESSQDHKAVFDGDRGPNTGGMGAYSPAPVLDPALQQEVMARVIEPTVQGMAAEGTRFQGFLYAGLMVGEQGPQVLEFNCRLGDPETQPLMVRLADDLVPYLVGVARGELPTRALSWDSRASLCVVMASGGYPGSYDKGQPIQGLEAAEALEDVVVFHAGTAAQGGGIVTAGGRVLGVTALGDGIPAAQARAYEAVERITWEGVHYRRDIGHRAVAADRT
jgi:phosphoribosylamine--glycine ligase